MSDTPDLAPLVEPAWVSAFIVTLRSEEVPGRDIADALAEVNDYIGASGLGVEEAFGPAPEYARSLRLAADRPQGVVRTLRAAILPAYSGGLGMVCCLAALRPLRDATEVGITLGQAVGMAILAGLMAVLGLKRDVLPRLARLSSLGGLLVGFVTMAALVLPNVLLEQTILRLAPWPVLVTGVVLLGLATIAYLRHRVPVDPLEPPLERTPEKPIVPQAYERVSLVLAVGYPVATIVVGALIWWT